MKKEKRKAFGKTVYLLGADSDGTKYWLEEANWDCDWYWGGGYVETYEDNDYPERSKDISSHQHFNNLFFKGHKNGHDKFTEVFAETPFTDEEIWKICELMRSFYIAREYSDMVCRGGAHYTTSPVKNIIQNDDHYNHVNKVVIPEIMNALYKILY